MCGIGGIICLSEGAASPEREELLRMASAMRHRGPDEQGLYRDSRAGLVHTRLSIIDLATGQQPIANEDETLWLVFNGEIFNYLELREELVKEGHTFRTKSDTEVILHAYEAWGTHAFSKMNGQWAVAIWDTKSRELVLCRDRLGVRPLYYAEHEGRLHFASEAKGIFAGCPGLSRELDPEGMAQTFTFWSVLAPRTAFRRVREVRPGFVRHYRRGAAFDEPYFRQSFPRARERVGVFAGDLDEATREVRAALERATALRMLRADVPVGSYLSGGLDSSLIAALGLRAKGSGFQTYSIRFEDAEYDETHYQRLMARHLGTEHHELSVSRTAIAEAFPEVVRFAERPVLRTAPTPLFLLSGEVQRSGIKVVLTGEGADEMFAGYDLFREGKIRRFWAKQPGSEARPRLFERIYTYLARSPASAKGLTEQFFGRNHAGASAPGFAHELRFQTTGALRRMFSGDMTAELEHYDPEAEFFGTLPPELSEWSSLSQDQYIENVTLLSSYLLSAQGDRMLMGHSVEGRFPFLDKEVIDLSSRLPSRYKLFALDEKHILKRVARDLLPKEVLERKKQPYRSPDAYAFTGEGRPAYVSELLSDDYAKRVGVFEPRAVSGLWQKCLKRREAGQFSNADNMALCGILSTHLLHASLVEKTEAFEPERLNVRTMIERA